MFIVTYYDKKRNIKKFTSRNVYENGMKLEQKLKNGLKLEDIIEIKETKE